MSEAEFNQKEFSAACAKAMHETDFYEKVLEWEKEMRKLNSALVDSMKMSSKYKRKR